MKINKIMEKHLSLPNERNLNLNKNENEINDIRERINLIHNHNLNKNPSNKNFNCNQSFESFNSTNKNSNTNNENDSNLNSLFAEANNLKNEYIQQRTSVEELFEMEEITIKNEDLLGMYDFGDRQHNLIDVN